MTESVLWNYIRANVTGPDWVRVENEVGPGTPDVNYAYEGSEGWMELKYRPTYPRNGEMTAFPPAIGLRTEQEIWIDTRYRAGGTVWIVGGIVKDVYIVSGKYAMEFNSMSYDRLRKISSLTLRRGKPVEFRRQVINFILTH